MRSKLMGAPAPLILPTPASAAPRPDLRATIPPAAARKMAKGIRALADAEIDAEDRIHKIIQGFYPGHDFEPEVCFRRQMIFIHHPAAPDNIAITIRLGDEDVEGRIYMRLCGEFLERLGIARRALTETEADDADAKIGSAEAEAAFSDVKMK